MGSISLALIGEMALNLCVMEFLYESCPLSRPSELKVSLLYVYSICSVYLLRHSLLVLIYFSLNRRERTLLSIKISSQNGQWHMASTSTFERLHHECYLSRVTKTCKPRCSRHTLVPIGNNASPNRIAMMMVIYKGHTPTLSRPCIFGWTD